MAIAVEGGSPTSKGSGKKKRRVVRSSEEETGTARNDDDDTGNTEDIRELVQELKKSQKENYKLLQYKDS